MRIVLNEKQSCQLVASLAKMNITTTSFWLDNVKQFPLSIFVEKESLDNQTYDIVIIGGGITGVSCAFHILQQDSTKSVAILERRQLCGGATGRNGGHLWYVTINNCLNVCSIKAWTRNCIRNCC